MNRKTRLIIQCLKTAQSNTIHCLRIPTLVVKTYEMDRKDILVTSEEEKRVREWGQGDFS